jgi:hypothetical protein
MNEAREKKQTKETKKKVMYITSRPMSELVNVTQTAAALTKIFGAEKYYHYYYYYSEIFISKCFLPSYCPPAALKKRRPSSEAPPTSSPPSPRCPTLPSSKS